jgi:hypothetical protein
MALTWGTLFVGAAILFVLPLAIVLLNRRSRHAGWWLLAAAVALVIVGNLAEKVAAAPSSDVLTDVRLPPLANSHSLLSADTHVSASALRLLAPI